MYYLLNGRRTIDLRPALLRTLAVIDGAVVMDKGGDLLAFGAILRHHNEGGAMPGQGPEGGGRTAAALAASRYGRALKISEDGIISFYEKGNWVWDL